MGIHFPANIPFLSISSPFRVRARPRPCVCVRACMCVCVFFGHPSKGQFNAATATNSNVKQRETPAADQSDAPNLTAQTLPASKGQASPRGREDTSPCSFATRLLALLVGAVPLAVVGGSAPLSSASCRILARETYLHASWVEPLSVRAPLTKGGKLTRP